MPIGETLVVALVGMLIVFFGLIIIMAVIKIQSAALKAAPKESEKAPAQAATAPVAQSPATADVKPRELAPGRSGEISLYDVDDRTAALIMAIVADEMKTPVNEIKFISIKEV